MRILFVGDVIGGIGRRLAASVLPDLCFERQVDFVIMNGENAAGGKGLTPRVARELFAMGVHVLTGGNHTWQNREIFDVIDNEPRILRPANYPLDPNVPGRGDEVYNVPGTDLRVGVLNLLGRAFMDPVDCPFRVGLEAVERLRKRTPLILVDFHAEATSEKVSLGWLLDGKVTAVIGTHTHIPTADETILPEGTAYQTDAGMTGPFDGVLGVQRDVILHRMLTRLPVRHELATGDLRLCGVLIEADPKTGRAQSIERICIRRNRVQD